MEVVVVVVGVVVSPLPCWHKEAVEVILSGITTPEWDDSWLPVLSAWRILLFFLLPIGLFHFFFFLWYRSLFCGCAFLIESIILFSTCYTGSFVFMGIFISSLYFPVVSMANRLIALSSYYVLNVTHPIFLYLLYT